MGKWRIPPIAVPGNPGPEPATPLERELVREEEQLAEAIAAVEAAIEEGRVPPITLPIPVPEPVVPLVPGEECVHRSRTNLHVNTADGLLYTLDPATGAVLNTLFVPFNEPEDTSQRESLLSVNPDTGEVYVSHLYSVSEYGPDQGGEQVAVIDANGNFTHYLEVGTLPFPVAVDTAHNIIYVPINGDIGEGTTPYVAVVDGQTNTLITTIYLPGNGYPRVIMIDPATGDAYVSGWSSLGTGLWRLDAGTHTPTLLEERDAIFYNAVSDFAHGRIFITAVENGSPYIEIYDIAGGNGTVYDFPGGGTTNIVYDDLAGLVYFTGIDEDHIPTVYVFDPNHPTDLPVPVVTFEEDDYFLYGLEVDPERHLLYFTLEGATNHGLYAYNTEDWEQVFKADLGSIPLDVKLGSVCDAWA